MGHKEIKEIDREIYVMSIQLELATSLTAGLNYGFVMTLNEFRIESIVYIEKVVRTE